MESNEQMSTWSSFPEQKLLQENWRGFLNEQVIYNRHVKILMESLQEVEDDLEKGRDPKIEDISIVDQSEIQKYINSLKKELGFAFELTGKFGAGITGLYGPLLAIIKNTGFTATEKDIVLILIAVMSYAATGSEMKELVDVIKEKDLTGPYKIAKALPDIFVKIVKNIVGTSYSFLDLIGYTFLFIPIINMVTQIITHNNITGSNLTQLVNGVLASIASYSGKIFLQRIKDKLKDK
jgi:hypothetical protein